MPKGVKEIECFLVGAGGTGSIGGWGGGGGYTKTEKLSVKSGDEINVAVGASNISDGGSSIINDIESAGGIRGAGSTYNNRGYGGSGGGACGYYDGDLVYGGNGGSDGSDGYIGSGNRGIAAGKGQGTTTRAFEEPNGTLYAGGGGGYGSADSYVWASRGGAGGAGGGGNGGSTVWTDNGFAYRSSSSGLANTGGGGGSNYESSPTAMSGGSGIAIIRWGY